MITKEEMNFPAEERLTRLRELTEPKYREGSANPMFADPRGPDLDKLWDADLSGNFNYTLSDEWAHIGKTLSDESIHATDMWGDLSFALMLASIITGVGVAGIGTVFALGLGAVFWGTAAAVAGVSDGVVTGITAARFKGEIDAKSILVDAEQKRIALIERLSEVTDTPSDFFSNGASMYYDPTLKTVVWKSSTGETQLTNQLPPGMVGAAEYQLKAMAQEFTSLMKQIDVEPEVIDDLLHKPTTEWNIDGWTEHLPMALEALWDAHTVSAAGMEHTWWDTVTMGADNWETQLMAASAAASTLLAVKFFELFKSSPNTIDNFDEEEERFVKPKSKR